LAYVPANHAQDNPFRASWWLPGRHAQTIWPALFRRARITARSERLELPDGDFAQLDWVGPLQDKPGAAGSPIIIMLPGLQGDLQSPYLAGMLHACAARRWRGVLLNHRGRVEPNRLPRSYHCGMTSDIDYLVRQLAQREPGAPIAVVGFSLGANMLLRWLGECGQRGEKLPVAAAVVVSAPFYLGPAAKKIERGFSRIYQWNLLRSLRKDVLRKFAVLARHLSLTENELSQLTTFYKFDDRITAPLNGFLGADDYYSRTRSDILLKHITVPTLIVNADNDPLIPPELIPPASELSPCITLEITRGGGHLGFVSGPWPWSPRYWLDIRVPAFLANYVASASSR